MPASIVDLSAQEYTRLLEKQQTKQVVQQLLITSPSLLGTNAAKNAFTILPLLLYSGTGSSSANLQIWKECTRFPFLTPTLEPLP